MTVPRNKITLYPEVDGIGSVELIQYMGTDKMIVDAARVSFLKDATSVPFEEEKDTKLIRFLMKNQHTSPFEHCQITWRFEVPLFVRGQHHRHRTWAYNEVSRRYTSEALKFYTPKNFRSQAIKNKQGSNEDVIDPQIFMVGELGPERLYASKALKVHVSSSVELYGSLMEAGVSRELARMVLPQNMYVAYYGSVSLLNAFKFLKLRLDPHAQLEIRRVAEAMKEHLETLFPVATKAFLETAL